MYKIILPKEVGGKIADLEVTLEINGDCKTKDKGTVHKHCTLVGKVVSQGSMS